MGILHLIKNKLKLNKARIELDKAYYDRVDTITNIKYALNNLSRNLEKLQTSTSSEIISCIVEINRKLDNALMRYQQYKDNFKSHNFDAALASVRCAEAEFEDARTEYSKVFDKIQDVYGEHTVIY